MSGWVTRGRGEGERKWRGTRKKETDKARMLGLGSGCGKLIRMKSPEGHISHALTYNLYLCDHILLLTTGLLLHSMCRIASGRLMMTYLIICNYALNGRTYIFQNIFLEIRCIYPFSNSTDFGIGQQRESSLFQLNGSI